MTPAPQSPPLTTLLTKRQNEQTCRTDPTIGSHCLLPVDVRRSRTYLSLGPSACPCLSTPCPNLRPPFLLSTHPGRNHTLGGFLPPGSCRQVLLMGVSGKSVVHPLKSNLNTYLSLFMYLIPVYVSYGSSFFHVILLKTSFIFHRVETRRKCSNRCTLVP